MSVFSFAQIIQHFSSKEVLNIITFHYFKLAFFVCILHSLLLRDCYEGIVNINTKKKILFWNVNVLIGHDLHT